ncbi:hypothetical protein GJ496_001997 [Pomphorhynchus laevis]|nr:hypothetical protein GJ496_001997 [Pomphorhynchus laevis]
MSTYYLNSKITNALTYPLWTHRSAAWYRELITVLNKSSSILCKCSGFLFTNKPENVIMQSVDENLRTHSKMIKELNTNKRHWIVHRLDRCTSGIVCLAESEQAARQFARDKISNRDQIKKYYLAIVDGLIKSIDGQQISKPLYRDIS